MRNNVFFLPLHNYCLYLVPTSCFLPSYWQAAFLISSAAYARCLAILFIFVALLFLLPFTSQSIWAHLLYVDHCFGFGLRERAREAERVRRKSTSCEALQSFFWMAYCVLHWRRSRTALGGISWELFAESASWRLLCLISFSVKIMKAREKFIIIDIFTPLCRSVIQYRS